MKGQRNQPKKRPGLEFCDFRLEKNSSERHTFALKPASYSNFGNSGRAKLWKGEIGVVQVGVLVELQTQL